MDSLASILSISRSGFQLGREDVEWMKNAIASEESAMADLDAKILALEAQRDTLEKSLPIRRALVAPIRRLPPEVLAEIFEHCLPANISRSDCVTEGSSSGNPMTRQARLPLRADNPKSAPFLLLRVCHRWRDIAEQTGRLWTNVSICCERSIPYASLRLQNSRVTPLDVFIFSKENCDCCCHMWTRRSRPALRGLQDNEQGKEIVKEYPEFYKGLFSKLPLTTRLEYHGSFQVLSRLLAINMNSLKEVSITLRAHEVHGEHFPILKATHLRTLALYNAAHLVTYIAPTDNLRRLTLTCTEEELFIDPICDFLRSCPGIEEFIFRCGQSTTIRRANQSQSPIHLRALSNLQLQIYSISDPEWIGLLHAPNLRVATILNQHMDLQPLQQFLSIARESLKSLTFQEFNFSSRPLRELLGTLHELETLVLSKCGHCGTLWEYLTPGEGVPPECWICPRLQHLDIRFSKGLEDPGFIEFIWRRSADHTECPSSQHNRSSYLFDINFHDCVVWRSLATALSNLQDVRKGLTITGVPENPMEDEVSYNNEWGSSNQYAGWGSSSIVGWGSGPAWP